VTRKAKWSITKGHIYWWVRRNDKTFINCDTFEEARTIVMRAIEFKYCLERDWPK
jgi:hypothetical protein